MKLVDSTTIFLVAIFLVLALTGVFLYTQLQTDPITDMVTEERQIDLLVVVHEEGKPITTFLFFLNPVTMRGAILDVPSDVGVIIPTRSQIDAIGSAFNPDDPDSYRKIVGDLVGREIPFHLVFSRQTLSDFIDLLGGLEMFVITDYREIDRVDPLLLPSGNVLLDGSKALDYLTAPADENGDRELISRRQSFAHSLLRAIRSNTRLLNHQEVRRVRDRLVVTNLDQDGVDSFVSLLADLKTDTLIRRRIQGTERNVVVSGTQKTLLFPHFEGQWLRQTVNQIQQAIARAADDSTVGVEVTVEVLNGTSTTGLARRTSQLLEGFGFEVIRFGNADNNQTEQTVVIDRRGAPELAQRVAQSIQGNRVVTEPLPESDVDVTVILGKDFDGSVVRNESE